MPEFLLDNDPDLVQWVRPDDTGFTVRTQFKGTQEALDRNARLRRGLLDGEPERALPEDRHGQGEVKLGERWKTKKEKKKNGLF